MKNNLSFYVKYVNLLLTRCKEIIYTLSNVTFDEGEKQKMNQPTNHIEKEMERKIEAAFQSGIRLGKKIAATPSFCPVCDAQFQELIDTTDEHLKEAKLLIRELRGIPSWVNDEQFEEVVDLRLSAREAWLLKNSPYFPAQLQRTRSTETIGKVRI